MTKYKDEMDPLRLQINQIDGGMLTLLAARKRVVEEVGRVKERHGQSLQASDREAAMFAGMEQSCAVHGLDFDVISEIWSTVIYHSKVTECLETGVESFLSTKPVPRAAMRQDLLDLTESVAPTYAGYCEGDGSDAVRKYRLRERHAIISAMSNGLPSKQLALDLGCATGQVANLLEEQFACVKAFDISPHMIQAAKERITWQPTTSFDVADLEEEIPVKTGTVDLLVANFGSASELGSDLLKEVRRVLRPGGKAVLSYYNQDALLNFWFYPWPSTVHARLNRHNGTLEVWANNRVYTVQAVGKTVKDLKLELRGHGLEIVSDKLQTYPTLQSILPRFFFSATLSDSKTMIQIADQIDDHLSHSQKGLHRGTYILTEVQKK